MFVSKGTPISKTRTSGSAAKAHKKHSPPKCDRTSPKAKGDAPTSSSATGSSVAQGKKRSSTLSTEGVAVGKKNVMTILTLQIPPLLHMSQNLMILIHQRTMVMSNQQPRILKQRNLIPRIQTDLLCLGNLRIPLAFSQNCLVFQRMILTGRNWISGFLVRIIF